MTEPGRRGPGGPESTPLLTRVTEQALEYDYEAFARRRTAASAQGGGRSRYRATVVMLVFAALAVTAGVGAASTAGVAGVSRATLINKVQQQRQRVAENQQLRARLNRAVDRLRDRQEQLIRRQQELTARMTRLETVTGYGPVVGPGVRIKVGNPPVDNPVYAVRDEDLAMLVDGLWNAGAEAIAVNGERLTVRSAFRNAGAAIRLNRVTLSPPYVVEAIGNPDTLQAGLADSRLGLMFLSLVQQLNFSFSMENVESLRLPGETLRRLRHVEILRDAPSEEGGR